MPETGFRARTWLPIPHRAGSGIGLPILTSARNQSEDRFREKRMNQQLNIDGLLDALAGILAEKVATKLENNAGTGAGSVRQRLLTVDQAGSYLGRTREAVQHMVANGKLRSVRADRRVFVDRRDLDVWIEQNKF